MLNGNYNEKTTKQGDIYQSLALGTSSNQRVRIDNRFLKD